MGDVSKQYTSRSKALKNIALGIANMAAEVISTDHDKKGILLCEGKEESFDRVLYACCLQITEVVKDTLGNVLTLQIEYTCKFC